MNCIANQALLLFGDRLAPDGSLVRENFAAWFGASKVVDGQGAPMRVYHGTGTDTGNSINPGTYFSGRCDVADIYAKAPTRQVEGGGPNVTPAYLSLQNPYVFDAQTVNDNLSHHVMGTRSRLDVVFAELARRGHDGLIIKNYDDLGGMQDQYVSFCPSQVKSAVGNSGLFDGDSDSLDDSHAFAAVAVTDRPRLRA